LLSLYLRSADRVSRDISSVNVVVESLPCIVQIFVRGRMYDVSGFNGDGRPRVQLYDKVEALLGNFLINCSARRQYGAASSEIYAT
jgi:hypothetical protein